MGVVSTGVLMLLLTGCAAPTSEEAPATPPAAEQAAPAIGPAPLVEITFAWEGAERTVSGTPDRNFCKAGPSDMFTSTDPLTDAGVSTGSEPGEGVSVMAWATDDLAVSFTGQGAVNRTVSASGDTVWGNDASGEAWVAPAKQLAGERVSQSDLAGFEAVAATASFVMTCDAEGSG